MSLRAYLELAVGAGLTGLLIWQMLTAASLRASLATQKAYTTEAQMRYQAAQTGEASCQAALGQVQVATRALADATVSVQGAVAEAVQARSDAAQATRQEVTRLLSVRAAPGQDCQTATGLARAAWEEGQ